MSLIESIINETSVDSNITCEPRGSNDFRLVVALSVHPLCFYGDFVMRINYNTLVLFWKCFFITFRALDMCIVSAPTDASLKNLSFSRKP